MQRGRTSSPLTTRGKQIRFAYYRPALVIIASGTFLLEAKTMNEEERQEAESEAKWKVAGKVGLAAATTSIALVAMGTAPFLRRFTGAPYVSSSVAARKAISKAIREHYNGHREARRMVLVDLGSGSGEIVLDAARAGYSAKGFELNVWLVALSRWRAWRAGLSPSQAKFVWGDLWKSDVAKADAVVVFGVPDIMKRVEVKVASECDDGCLVCCNTFALRGMTESHRSGGVWFYKVRRGRRGQSIESWPSSHEA